MKNYWNEFEYSKLKLLLNNRKVESIIDVYNGKKDYDELYPISVDIHLTNICNLKCSWCTDQEIMKCNATLEKDIVFSLLEDFGKHGTGVTLEGGGEPTLHKDFSEIVDYGYKNEVDLGLITNGVKDISQDVRKFKWIRISLDSCDRKQYAVEKGVDCFDRVLENIRKMSDSRNYEKTFIGVGYVITNRNINLEKMKNMVEILDKIGVDYIYFRPVEEAEDLLPSVEDMINLKRELIKWTENKRIRYLINIYDRVIKNNNEMPCVAHSITSIIHADGTVNLCEKRRHDEICLGNILENSFYELWNSNTRILASSKLLCSECQNGCDVCRITGFNDIIHNLMCMNTKKFI